MTTTAITLLVDKRWPSETGIGVVQEALLERAPPHISIKDTCVAGKLGDPLSPLKIAISLLKFPKKNTIFWNPGFIPPLFASMPIVVTIHDLTHLTYYTRWHRLYYNLFYRCLYKSCAAIFCVSQFTKDEFVRWAGVDPQKVHVIYNAAEEAFQHNTEAANLGFPYLFYPGNRRVYKNINRLMQGYAASSLPRKGIHFVLTGEPTPELHAAAAALGIKDFVNFAGLVDRSDMPKLYRGALALAYVSLSEGFGLPLLEAMASDVPIITSNVSCMPEIVGDAALKVDPFSIDAIADGLDRIITDQSLRRCLIENGRARVKEFDWDKSAVRFWNIVMQQVSQRGSF